MRPDTEDRSEVRDVDACGRMLAGQQVMRQAGPARLAVRIRSRMLSQSLQEHFAATLRRDEDLHVLLELGMVVAIGAPGEVRLDLDRELAQTLAVDVALDLAKRLAACSPFSPIDESSLLGYAVQRALQGFLPRCRRDITVPIGTFVISAISL